MRYWRVTIVTSLLSSSSYGVDLVIDSLSAHSSDRSSICRRAA